VAAEEIAGAIGRLRSDPAYAWRLGAKGRRRVMENFTVDHMVRRTMEIYRQVLS
jgi:glycosyltransferase involved in cell wall biosynthesis